jgi:hypothetical protein
MIGQVMKETNGLACPIITRRIVEKEWRKLKKQAMRG